MLNSLHQKKGLARADLLGLQRRTFKVVRNGEQRNDEGQLEKVKGTCKKQTYRITRLVHFSGRSCVKFGLLSSIFSAINSGLMGLE